MSFKDDEKFYDKLKNSENRYAVIQELFQDCYDKINSCQSRISNSDVISWITQDKQPENLQKINHTYITKYELNYMEDFFCYITDKEICECVKKSYMKSKQKNNLVYYYKNIQEDYRKTRIRILTNMLWYELMDI